MREGEIPVITMAVRKGAVGKGRGNTGHSYRAVRKEAVGKGRGNTGHN